MANSISQTQNEDLSLRLLAAERGLYSQAKIVSSVQATLSLLTPVAVGALGAAMPDFKPWGALLALCVVLLDLGLLDPLVKGCTRAAAGIQEKFDTTVLELPWNGCLVTEPDPEEWSSLDVTDATLKEWYPVEVAALPLIAARVLCQRTNCWWDGRLRRTYAFSLLRLSGARAGTANSVSSGARRRNSSFAVPMPTTEGSLWITSLVRFVSGLYT